MYRRALLAVVGAAVMAMATQSCVAAEFKSFTSKEGRVLISIVGELVEGDTDQFKSAIKAANDAGKFVANIRLNSAGGNLLEGVKLADAVRFAKIATNVGKDGTCASACFLVFAAGATKYANYTARLGVHGASTRAGEEAGDATVTMARVAKELGVPSAIIGRMVVTPPSEMVWLSPQELQSMGTEMVGKPSQLPTAEQAELPKQVQPQEPLNIQPTAKAKATPTFEKFVEYAVKISADQNNGKPIVLRNCEPKFKVCWNVVAYRDTDGTDVSAKVTRDMDENIIKREICVFNKSGDIRRCFDWDKGATVRSMKDMDGNWIKIADE